MRPAAMRYTEVRMSRIAHELLADIDKETVDFTPNYDNSEHEPAVLPARIPNLLVNGSAGIAVGMATNIPPHNLGEIIDACIALIDDPNLGLADLMRLVPGPDFPTAGIINGAAEIVAAYKTGRGRLSVRARTSVETIDERGREAIVVTELPYQVNKARLLERIADLVRAKEIEGISELRDESDKDGLRVVIELKRGENSELDPEPALQADADGDRVRRQHGRAARRPAEAAVAQGDAGRVPAPPPRGRDAPDDPRPAQGTRARAPARGPRGRAREHRRSHRTHQGLAVAAGGAG